MRGIFPVDFELSKVDVALKEATPEFKIDVKYFPIKKYLEERDVFIQEVVVKREKGKYAYEVIEGKSEQIIIRILAPTPARGRFDEELKLIQEEAKKRGEV